MARPEKAPLRVTHQIGGLLDYETCRESVGFAATISSDPPIPVRLFLSSASTCSILRHKLYSDSGLQHLLPHSLTFRPLRPGVDKVRLCSICHPGREFTAVAVADCPIECEGRLLTPTVFLVEDSEQLELVDGILGLDFLREHAVNVAYTIDGQKLVFP